MSLSDLRKVSEQAVTFRSHIDGAKVELSPERSIEVQRLLGSDIAMQMDECVRLPAGRDDIEARDAAVVALGRAQQARVRDRA
jgi:queuine tRNA-ribosyltransferase